MIFLKKLFVTYTKENLETGEMYSGLSSGVDDGSLSAEELAQRIVKKRDTSHHKNSDGFLSANIDKSSDDYEAMRGREQLLIEFYGGAKQNGGTSGNKINSISRKNKKRNKYIEAALKLFGGLSLLLLIILFLKAVY